MQGERMMSFSENTSRSRRAVLAGIASAAALPIAAAVPVGASAADFPGLPAVIPELNAQSPTEALQDKISSPTSSAAVVAIERYRKASKDFNRCSSKLSEAREAAMNEHGREPYALIHWRNYYIGGGELKRTRVSFLRLGEDPATIENEYRDAKKRYRNAVKASKDWEMRAGLDGLSKKLDEARSELNAAERSLGTVEVRSIADASALLELLRPNVKFGDIQNWEIAAMNNASKFLKLASSGKAVA
jgi:hypothetical protein